MHHGSSPDVFLGFQVQDLKIPPTKQLEKKKRRNERVKIKKNINDDDNKRNPSVSLQICGI